MSSLIRISDISLYLRCPRLVYFDSLGSFPRTIIPEQLLLRSLMLSLSGESDVEGQLKAALTRLEQELPLVYGIEPEEIIPACRALEEKMPQLAKGIASNISLILPCEVDIDLRSDRLGLTGRLDRLILKDRSSSPSSPISPRVPSTNPSRIPSLIRLGHAPEDGVWKRDRLMLAGYSLLLAEKYGTKIDLGLVEYPRSAVIREVGIHSVDKSRVLRIRDRIQQIKEGTLPDRSDDAHCDKCEVKERCETRHSLASKFF